MPEALTLMNKITLYLTFGSENFKKARTSRASSTFDLAQSVYDLKISSRNNESRVEILHPAYFTARKTSISRVV